MNFDGNENRHPVHFEQLPSFKNFQILTGFMHHNEMNGTKWLSGILRYEMFRRKILH